MPLPSLDWVAVLYFKMAVARFAGETLYSSACKEMSITEPTDEPIQVAGHGTIANKALMVVGIVGLIAAAGLFQHDKTRDRAETVLAAGARLGGVGWSLGPRGLVSRKDEQLLSFNEITRFNVDEGTFHVWKRDARKSVIQEPTSEPNFYPGYLLLTSMYRAARENSEEAIE